MRKIINKIYSLAKNGRGLQSALVHSSGLAIRLGFMLGLAHWTSPEVIGLYGLTVSIEAVVVYLAGLEFHTFTARRFAKTGELTKLRMVVSAHRKLLWFSAPLAAVVGVLAAIIFSLTNDWLVLVLVGILLASGVVAQELGRYLNLARKPVNSVFLSVLRASAWQPFALIAIAANTNKTDNLLSMLVFWALFTVLGCVWSALVLKNILKSKMRINIRYVWRGLKESRAYHGIASLSVLQSNLERFLLQLLLGPAAVGVFSFFQMLANTLTALVQTATLNVALPDLLTWFGQRNTGRFEYLAQLRKRILLISIVSGLLVCGAAIPLTMLLSKNDYLAHIWLLPVLISAQVLLMWTQPIHLAMYAARYDALLLRIMTGALVASLMLDFLFINWVGLAGAVVAPFVVYLSVAFLRVATMRKLVRHKII